MIQRENGPIPTEFRLWKPVNDVNDWLGFTKCCFPPWVLIVHRFQHAVTKAKTRTPSPEIGGGILAEEMGMGKSLSILALITHTLDGADIWVQQQLEDATEEDNSKHKPSRTTLIVVPSASKLSNVVDTGRMLTNIIVLINEWLNEINM
jgi:SWI/SNF-related matrix-associated actin-dependent regulator of chromatin subfamily A3